MNYAAAKHHLRLGAVMRREAWYDGAQIQAETIDPKLSLRLVDECGREYGVSKADMWAEDWVIIQEASNATERD